MDLQKTLHLLKIEKEKLEHTIAFLEELQKGPWPPRRLATPPGQRFTAA